MPKTTTKAPPTHTDKKYDLARLLGLARPTLDKILDEPDCPKPAGAGWNVQKMLDFVRVYAARNRQQNTGDLASADIVALRMRKLTVDVNKAELQYQLDRNQYVERKTAIEVLGKAVAETQAAFQRAFEQDLPPKLVGLNASEIKMKLRESFIEVLTELHEKAKEGFPEPGV